MQLFWRHAVIGASSARTPWRSPDPGGAGRHGTGASDHKLNPPLLGRWCRWRQTFDPTAARHHHGAGGSPPGNPAQCYCVSALLQGRPPPRPARSAEEGYKRHLFKTHLHQSRFYCNVNKMGGRRPMAWKAEQGCSVPWFFNGSAGKIFLQISSRICCLPPGGALASNPA